MILSHQLNKLSECLGFMSQNTLKHQTDNKHMVRGGQGNKGSKANQE